MDEELLHRMCETYLERTDTLTWSTSSGDFKRMHLDAMRKILHLLAQKLDDIGERSADAAVLSVCR